MMARRTMPSVRDGKLLKIILYGSYARGDWVADPVGRYYSDFDLLVVVDRGELTDVAEYWYKIEERILAKSSRRIRTPVSLIVHSLFDVNEQLGRGRYFFMDVVREGIILFDEPGHPFVEPQPLSASNALQETRTYFEEWFESAGEFYDDYRSNLEKGRLKKSAFELHQATERFYHCFLLVRTLYSPSTHNLNRLRSLAEDMELRLRDVWPRDSKFERRCYELLREAYVKARYSRHYQITPEQLEWLGSRMTRCAT